MPALVNGYPAFAPELSEHSGSFEIGYFAQLFDLEAGSFWFRARNRLIIWALQQYFPQARTFLEIGCGTGIVLSGIKEALPDMTLFGSEASETGIGFAESRLPGVELFQMDARQIPFEDEFDVIGAFDLLEHIKEDTVVLSQMRQATRKQGGIILTVAQHPFLWSRFDEYACHVRRYRLRELKGKVEQAGFNVVRLTSFVSLLLPLMLISRLKHQTFDEKYDVMSDLKISRLMDNVLEKILDVERAMIRSGISLPAGGSLLLVARRS